MSATNPPRPRVLILWNQTEEDIYEKWQQRGPVPLPWDATRLAAEVRSVSDEMDELIEAVQHSGYQVTCINTRDDIDVLIGALRLYRPDVVLNLIEYFHDDAGLESGIVGLYELFGAPYTGSAGYALSLCQRKHHTKRALEAVGLPTAWYFVVENVDAPIPEPEALVSRFPFIVKPALEDASGGIDERAVVHDYRELLVRVHHVLSEFEQPALVEQYIEGREIHVAILGNDNPEVLPLFEMGFDDEGRGAEGEWRPRIISFDGKWDPLSRDFYALVPMCPAADVGPETELLLAALALRAYRVTGCRDYARIDMRIDGAGMPYILEVNPNPDLTNGSAFIMCATASGRSYAETLEAIIELSRARAAQACQDLPDVDGGVVDDDERDAPMDLLNRKYR